MRILGMKCPPPVGRLSTALLLVLLGSASYGEIQLRSQIYLIHDDGAERLVYDSARPAREDGGETLMLDGNSDQRFRYQMSVKNRTDYVLPAGALIIEDSLPDGLILVSMPAVVGGMRRIPAAPNTSLPDTEASLIPGLGGNEQNPQSETAPMRWENREPIAPGAELFIRYEGVLAREPE
mgnify:CR=1 FL=1